MTVMTNERKARNQEILKKILIYTSAIIGGAVLLAVAYQILKFLLVGVILFLAWLCPTRWR